METETEKNKEHQRKNSDSSLSSSSSRCSSITSDSSDGHFDIRHFPLPKPPLSASEAQKLRDAHQAYNSSVSSYTGSSWSSIRQNHLNDTPGYDPTRIPSSVFSSKPDNSAEWSIASNESLFSIHDMNFNISKKEDHGSAAALRLAEIPRFEETVHQITEINPVEATEEEEPYQVEKSDPEIDDSEKEENMSEVESESDDEHDEEEEEEEIIEAEVIVETETRIPEEKEVVQVVKDNKPEDSNSIVSHSPSISCLSDISNNSIGSFAFPVLGKEDAVIKTPSMEIIRRNVSHKLPQSPVLPPQQHQQPQPYSASSTLTDLHPKSQQQPQPKASKKFESRTQSLKASSIGWFSCFHCPSKCSIFK